jgi:hypothetical protein
LKPWKRFATYLSMMPAKGQFRPDFSIKPAPPLPKPRREPGNPGSFRHGET